MSTAVHTLLQVAAVVWILMMAMVALLATTQAFDGWLKREEQKRGK